MSAAVPTNGATSQATSVVCTLTFNNALAAGEDFDRVLINNTTHAQIAGTNTIDTTRKIVTVVHTAARQHEHHHALHGQGYLQPDSDPDELVHDDINQFT